MGPAETPDAPAGAPVWDPEERRRGISRRIRALQARSTRGLWYVCLFVLVSAAARSGFSILPSLPEGVRDFLGRPPPPPWINVALVVYSFSALILTLSRMMGGSEPRDGWMHVGYLTAFYGFYHLAGALPENFWAVFVAGLTILGLQAYTIWTCCAELLREEQERLQALDGRAEQSD